MPADIRVSLKIYKVLSKSLSKEQMPPFEALLDSLTPKEKPSPDLEGAFEDLRIYLRGRMYAPPPASAGEQLAILVGHLDQVAQRLGLPSFGADLVSRGS